MTVHPSLPSGSTLHQRMIEDMSVRGFTKKTQRHLRRHPGGYSCHFIRPNWRLPSAHARQKRQPPGPND
jgi:hypothetical protein